MNGRRVLGATKKVTAFLVDGKLWGGSISEPGCWVQAPDGLLRGCKHRDLTHSRAGSRHR